MKRGRESDKFATCTCTSRSSKALANHSVRNWMIRVMLIVMTHHSCSFVTGAKTDGKDGG